MSEHMLELLRDAQAERNALRARVGSLEEMLADAAADVAVAIAECDRLRRELEALRDEMREWCHGLDTAACHRAVLYGPTIDRLDAILRGES